MVRNICGDAGQFSAQPGPVRASPSNRQRDDALLPRGDSRVGTQSAGGADSFADDGGSEWRTLDGRRGDRELDRDDGGRSGNDDESDRERNADSAAASGRDAPAAGQSGDDSTGRRGIAAL